MLQVHIDRIGNKGLDLDQVLEIKEFPLLTAIPEKETIAFTHPVHVRIHATRADETVLIEGAAETKANMVCSRCLTRFDLTVKAEFSATATQDPPDTAGTDPSEAIELSAEEMDVINFTGNNIGIGDEVSQQLMMALPIKPLCRDRCKGLCDNCGADLNKISCKCASSGENSPFSILQGLSFPEDKR